MLQDLNGKADDQSVGGYVGQSFNIGQKMEVL